MSEGVYARMQKEKVRVMEEITKEQGIDKSALIKGFRLLYARLKAFLGIVSADDQGVGIKTITKRLRYCMGGLNGV
ncbi:MAG: hypothetical protein QXT77_02060 [Candidatus Methanomethylicaceae archaeon]